MEKMVINVPDGYEIQIVRKGEKKEPIIRTYQDLINDGKYNYKYNCKGYYINDDSEILELSRYTIMDLTCRNIASSEKVAKSMLAMAQISQLMPYYGGEITDEELGNSSIYKYIIRKEGGKINTGISYTTYYFLAFHTEEQRNDFLKYNERLVKDYLMID